MHFISIASSLMIIAINVFRKSAKQFTRNSRDDNYNPLLPSVPYMARSAKILNSIIEEIIKNISYERRDYESVDKKSLS